MTTQDHVAKQQMLVITRMFDAPRELVWTAWTEPERFMRWWGPKDYTSPRCEIDFRVGGRYFACMRSPEGQDYHSTGVYREIIARERLVYTDNFADADGNVVAPSHYGMAGSYDETLVTVTLDERDGKTTMTLTHAGLPAGEMLDMTGQGWNESFDKLAESLQSPKK